MVKSVIYLHNRERYEGFYDIFQNEFENPLHKNSYKEFEEEIKANQNNITLVFIESTLVGDVSEELAYILNRDNFICSLLTINPQELEDFVWPRYFEYYLDMNNEIMVCTLFVRIRKNLHQRMKAMEYNRKVGKFYEVVKYLPVQRNLEDLLELTINYSMEISSADAASIYLVVDKETNDLSFYDTNSNTKLLKFAIAKNNSLITDLKSTTLPISSSSIVGYTVINGESLLIEDAYDIPKELEYKFDFNYDKCTGYRTISILSIPMKDSENRVLGVIQLINKRVSHDGLYENNAIPFDKDDEQIIFALLGQSAVTLENIMLIKDKNELLQKYESTISEEIKERKRVDEGINKLLDSLEEYIDVMMEQVSSEDMARIRLVAKELRSFSLNGYDS